VGSRSGGERNGLGFWNDHDEASGISHAAAAAAVAVIGKYRSEASSAKGREDADGDGR
jgi:hypothetical protein